MNSFMRAIQRCLSQGKMIVFFKGQRVHKCSVKMSIEYTPSHTIQNPTNGEQNDRPSLDGKNSILVFHNACTPN